MLLTSYQANLDPVIETAQIQRMINEHNIQVSATSNPKVGQRQRIKRTVFYTGYLISPADTQKLLTLVHATIPETDIRYLANNILITPRPAHRSILDKVGGIGARLRWEVTGTAVFEN